MKKEEVTLFEWGKFRWYECFIPLQYLYERYKEEWMLEHAKLLREQGVNYWDYINTWERPLDKWTLYTHIVNICMMLKYEAVSAKLLGEPNGDAAERLWKILDKYNGTAVGSFTGDECLSGVDNTRGTELCSIVELMYSCEILYAVTRKPIWADRLAKLAYNALPATISDDMWTHQYLQQVNQINCIKFPNRSYFRTNNGQAHLFGLEPHFGCCTANFGQGWPKFLANNYLKDKNAISVISLIPSELNTKLGRKPITVRIETEYPFRMDVKVTVTVAEASNCKVKLHIPAFAKTYTVNGEKRSGSTCVLDGFAAGDNVFMLSFTDTPHFVTRPDGYKTVEYGPLVFSLPIETEYKMYEYVRNNVERKFPYCDYELIGKSEWRYGFAEGATFSVVEKEGDVCSGTSKANSAIVHAGFDAVTGSNKAIFNVRGNEMMIKQIEGESNDE